jgi:hypothetical protein
MVDEFHGSRQRNRHQAGGGVRLKCERSERITLRFICDKLSDSHFLNGTLLHGTLLMPWFSISETTVYIQHKNGHGTIGEVKIQENGASAL